MLALSSASLAFADVSFAFTRKAPPPNPVQAAVNTVAQISVVGFDKRAYTNQLQQFIEPLRVDKKIDQAISGIVMTASVEREPIFDARSIGDLGFDPLGLGTDEQFVPFREAELKHGRLAMLAAIAWPLQEILHPIFVDNWYAVTGQTVPDVLLESNGASPSLLNGGLFQPEVLPALALTILVGSFLEERDLRQRAARGCAFNEYPILRRQTGNLGFDPLNIYRPLPLDEKRGLHEAELTNGRLAMLAVAGYVATEFVLGEPIVRATSPFFEPFIVNPAFRAFMDASFGMASMDGSIDGIAY
jgi:light-harvesting complex I chlorophyll a/b binding protein 1